MGIFGQIFNDLAKYSTNCKDINRFEKIFRGFQPVDKIVIHRFDFGDWCVKNIHRWGLGLYRPISPVDNLNS